MRHRRQRCQSTRLPVAIRRRSVVVARSPADTARLAGGGIGSRWSVGLADERTGKIEQPRAQMRAVPEQIRRAAPHRQEKRERRLVALQRVAGPAGEDEVVAAVVRGLTAPRCNMVERHHPRLKLEPAVRAARAIVLQQPRARGDSSVAGGRMRGQLAMTVRRRGLCAGLRRRLLSSAALARPAAASTLRRGRCRTRLFVARRSRAVWRVIWVVFLHSNSYVRCVCPWQ